VEVVVLAQPQSRRLGEYFHNNLSVPHVIAFEFPEITQELKYGHFNVLSWEIIFTFALEFYNNLLKC
jgi:hypothetical protein